MPHVDLPPGTYVCVANNLRLNKGGRTAAMLMRARMLAEHGGVRSVIATLSPFPEIEETRAALRERSHLGDSVELVNVYEDYLGRDLDALGRGNRVLPAVHGLEERLTPRPDGTPYRRSYVDPASSDPEDDPQISDFLRPDGSVAVRIDHGVPASVTVVDQHGRIVHTFRSRSQFLQHWLREVVGDGDGFLVTDSRNAIFPLLGLQERRMHVLSVFHNPHTAHRGRWDAPLNPTYEAVTERLQDLDGLVLLTQRQREELTLRYGPVDNLFSVGNPVVLPDLPQPLPERNPKQLVMIARLEGQKRVAHALRAFKTAYARDPELRLDVFGDGSHRDDLEKRARRLGVDAAVTFHGYDPSARASLQTAGAFLLTSLHEGYPLATLEAMSHGCPVISYDIRFGPREQITDGVDGFLVADGDIPAFAERIADLTSDPELAARMSKAAYEKAAAHSPRAFVEDWARVFHAVKAQDTERGRIHGGRLHGVRIADGTFSGRLRMRVSGGTPTPETARMVLAVTGEDDGETATTPISFRPALVGPRVDGLRLDGTLDGSAIADRLGEQPVRVALQVAWGRAAWQSVVARGEVRDGRLDIATTTRDGSR